MPALPSNRPPALPPPHPPTSVPKIELGENRPPVLATPSTQPQHRTKSEMGFPRVLFIVCSQTCSQTPRLFLAVSLNQPRPFLVAHRYSAKPSPPPSCSKPPPRPITSSYPATLYYFILFLPSPLSCWFIRCSLTHERGRTAGNPLASLHAGLSFSLPPPLL